MAESLLSPSQIKLFGRIYDGLRLQVPRPEEVDPNPIEADKVDPVPGPNPGFDLLANQLLKPDSRLARLYAFSYEGQLYTLPRPTIFLVHGPGRPVGQNFSGQLDVSGVALRDWAFEADIVFWEYDRVNYSLRCDIVSGTLDEILVDACINSASNNSARSDMASRGSDMSSRGSDMASRSDLTARHRIR